MCTISDVFTILCFHLCSSSLSSVSSSLCLPLLLFLVLCFLPLDASTYDFHQNVYILTTFFFGSEPIFLSAKMTCIVVKCYFSISIESKLYFCLPYQLFFDEWNPHFYEVIGGRWAKLDKLMTDHCSLLYLLIFFSSHMLFFWTMNALFMVCSMHLVLYKPFKWVW